MKLDEPRSRVNLLLMSSDSIFEVTNHHSESCGVPPRVNDESGEYRGYFENELGEQAIFIYNRLNREGTLYMGDAGWESPHAVVNGVVEKLVLSDDERSWLTACWRAATVT